MKITRILGLLLAALVIVLPARADGLLSNTFMAAGAGTSINNLNTAIAYHKLTWNVASATFSVCTVGLDSSTDGITWNSSDVITGQDCTANGQSTVVTFVANYVRIHVTTLTGTGTLNVTWTGYINTPATGAGTVTSIATTSPITGGTITGMGTIACPTCAVTSSFAALTDGATVTWAIGSAYLSNKTLLFTVHGGSRTLNITGPVSGGNYVLILTQDGTGGEGLILGTGCTWRVSGGGAGAITPSTGAGAVDVLAFTYDGANCNANFNKNFN